MTRRFTGAEWLFIVALLLFAATLRIVGVNYGQPDMSAFPTDAARDMTPYSVAVQPDEFLFVARPYRMLVTRQLNPQYFENPSFLINLNFFTYLLTGEGRGVTYESWQGIDEREHAPFRFYVIGRMYSALGGLLAVAALYALARRVAGRYAAVSAGLIVAASLTLVQHAHYTTTTSLASGFAAVALWAAITSLYRPRWLLFAVGGIAAGLAAGSRYNAAAVSLVVFAVGLILITRDQRRWRWVLLGWALFPISFALTTPHIFFAPEQVLADFRYITAQYMQGVGVTNMTTAYGLFYEYRYLIIFAIGVPAALASVVGLLAAWQTRPRRWRRANSALLATLITALYVVPYSLVVLTTARPAHSDQLLAPVIPAFALIAAVGADWIIRLINRRWFAPLLVVALVIIPLALSVQLVRQFTRTDTRYLMTDWIDDHLPRGAKIHLNGPYNVPLDPSYFEVTQNFGSDFVSLDDLKAQGVAYIVVSDAFYHDVEQSGEIAAPGYVDQVADYIALFETLPQVARIDRPTLLGDNWLTFTARIWHNPALAVYCVTAASCEAIR